MDFKNKVAIVTGGAQGIGKSFCLSLLEHGCKVCVCDINEKCGRDFVQEFSKKFQDKLIFVKCDVSILEEFRDVFKKTFEIFGYVDILINNAGVANENDCMKVIAVNFIGVVIGIQLAFLHMGVNNGGSGGCIINTASIVGLRPFELSPIYSATKHGIVGLTRSYGTDFHLKKTGVTVNAICPRSVDTDFFHTFAEKSVCEDSAKKLLSTFTLLDPSTVASALMKLLKDRRNGALLVVDENGFNYAA